jgi:hypothetical protein
MEVVDHTSGNQASGRGTMHERRDRERDDFAVVVGRVTLF